MRRRLFKLAGRGAMALLLAAAVLSVVLWVRSYSRADIVGWQHVAIEELADVKSEVIIATGFGGIGLKIERSAYSHDDFGRSRSQSVGHTLRMSSSKFGVLLDQRLVKEPTDHYIGGKLMYMRNVWNRLGFIVEWTSSPAWMAGAILFPSQKRFELAVPFWFVIALALIAPARVAWVAARSHRRSKRGRCPSCGYDVRASLGRCPECGTAMKQLA